MQMKDKVAATSATAGDVGDTSDAPFVDGDEFKPVHPSTEGTSEAPIILDVRPKKTSKNVSAEEDRVLAGIMERGQQSLGLQQQMIDMIKPPVRITERTTYADWTKSVMEELDHSLWRRFQIEHSQLLYRYLGMSDTIKSLPVAQRTDVVAQQAPSQQFRVQSQAHSPSPSTSSAMWQPSPQYWPDNVQPNTSVWRSQSEEWVQRQIQQALQSRPSSMTSTRGGSMIRRPVPPSTPAPASDSAYNLNIISEASATTPFTERLNSTDSSKVQPTSDDTSRNKQN